MKKWQKNRNYRKHENIDGTTTYTILIDGQGVEVSEEVFTAYAASERQLEYIELDLKRDRTLQDANGKRVKDANGQPIKLPEREISLDKLLDEDWDYKSPEPSPEDAVVGQFEIDNLHELLDSLKPEERELINALFFEGMTEREYAKVLGISKTALHARKIKVLAKLKNLFEIF